MTNTPRPYYTAQEMTELLGITAVAGLRDKIDRINSSLAAGAAPFPQRLPGMTWCFSRAAVDAWFDSNAGRNRPPLPPADPWPMGFGSFDR